jgi:hypothetical protein
MPRKLPPWAVQQWKKAIENRELGGSVDTCIDVTLMREEILVVI